MNFSDFRKSIMCGFTSLQEIGLTDWQDFPHHTSLQASYAFNKISLSRESDYQTIYKTGLREKHYNFLLSDFSYFQFSLLSERRSSVRLSFYPCPFNAIEDLRRTSPAIGEDDPESLDRAMEEATVFIDKPPIRYDFDPSAYVPSEHPAGHFHIGAHADNRWPARKIILPSVFSLLIAKHYYAEQWESKATSKLTANGYKNEHDQKLAEQLKICTSLDHDLFDNSEGLLLHLTTF